MIKGYLATLTQCSEILDKSLPVERYRFVILLAFVRAEMIKNQQHGFACTFLHEAPDAAPRYDIAVSMHSHVILHQCYNFCARVVVPYESASHGESSDATSWIVPDPQSPRLLETLVHSSNRSFVSLFDVDGACQFAQHPTMNELILN